MIEEDSNLIISAAETCVRGWAAMIAAVNSLIDVYVSGGTILDAFKQAISAGMSAFPLSQSGRTVEKLGPYDDVSFLQWLEPDVLSSLYTTATGQQVKIGNLQQSVDVWIRHVVRTIRGRRMVLGGKGYIVLVPEAAEVGDRICVLLGRTSPFVLREKDTGYVLIGEYYVHGLMSGEMAEVLRRGSGLARYKTAPARIKGLLLPKKRRAIVEHALTEFRLS